MNIFVKTDANSGKALKIYLIWLGLKPDAPEALCKTNLWISLTTSSSSIYSICGYSAVFRSSSNCTSKACGFFLTNHSYLSLKGNSLGFKPACSVSKKWNAFPTPLTLKNLATLS